MSAANTSTTPAPLDEQPAIIAPKTSTDNEGDSPNSSPGTSPSTWKPNADAAEWKPSFGSASADEIPDSGEGPDDANISLGSGAEGKQDVDDKPPGPDGNGDGIDTASVKPLANGGDATGDAKSSPPDVDASSPTKAEENGNPAERVGDGAKRYEIDFLIKLRPKPDDTPRPEGLNPPDRVDILWDGKEPPSLKAGGSMRGGIRPLPPLGGRMGSSSRGLGEARGAPPPLRGAQRDIGRDRDSRMGMDQRGSGGGRDDRRSGGGGNGRDRGGGGGGGRRAPIDTAPALEDCKPIEVNEATRWKPKSLEAKTGKEEGGADDDAKLSVDQVLMKANAILNKMTLEKFNKLSVTFMSAGLRDPEVISGVIDMIVDKAQMEPHFSSMYSNLCECIARTPIPALGESLTGKNAGMGSKKFRALLLRKCQGEFLKDWQGLFAAVQNDPDLAEEEKNEREFGLKRKYTGHMRFVGELYKVELLKERHVHAAIQDLFGNADEPDEEKLECMVKLLQTCGKKLDHTGSPETVKDMKRLFKRIGKLADSRLVSSRIRFMLRDLGELRKNSWIPRREEEKAKTMQELHNDIAKEEESKNRGGGWGAGGSSRPGTAGSGSSSVRPGSGDARVSSGSRPDSASSGTQPTLNLASKSSKDTKEVKITKDSDGWEVVPHTRKKGKPLPGGDGRSQAPASRSRSSNPGSDERRGGSTGGGASLVGQQSAFALLSSHDDEKEKKKKKKESKVKKEKLSKEKKKAKKSSKSSSSKLTTPKSTAVADEPPVPPPTVDVMTEEAARKKGKDMVAEFAVSGELSEICICLSEIDEALRWAAVSEALSDSMERKQKHRDALGVVLAAGAKEGLLVGGEGGSLLRGLSDVLDGVPDVCIDVPQAALYVAAAVAPLIIGEHVALGPLVASPCEGLLEGGKAAEFAVVVLAQVKAAAVADGLSEDAAAARVSELLGGALDLPKLAAMLPFICKGDEAKASSLLQRNGVAL